MERKSTGINGLDELIQGGIPENFAVLISGSAGCGKTILSSQFLWEGVQQGESGLYLTLEENPESIKSDAEAFGWDFDHEKIDVDYVNPVGGRRFIENVTDRIDEGGFERLVIDSISILLGFYQNDINKLRENFYKLTNSIKRSGSTAYFTSEVPEKEEDSLGRYEIEEFVVDGVIVLYYTGIGESSFRNIEVRKMRKTSHTPGTFPFQIKTGEGIKVKKKRL